MRLLHQNLYTYLGRHTETGILYASISFPPLPPALFFPFSEGGLGGGCWIQQQRVGRDEPDAGGPLPGPSQPGPSWEDAMSSPLCPGINGPAGHQWKRNPVFSSLLCPYRCPVARDACTCLLLCHHLCSSLETSTTAVFLLAAPKILGT